MALLNKNFALGLSPFFLSLILLPLAVTKGRKESVSNMALGIFAAVFYYGLGNLFTNSASPPVLLTFGWWGPNAVCLCLGLPPSYASRAASKLFLLKMHNDVFKLFC